MGGHPMLLVWFLTTQEDAPSEQLYFDLQIDPERAVLFLTSSNLLDSVGDSAEYTPSE